MERIAQEVAGAGGRGLVAIYGTTGSQVAKRDRRRLLGVYEIDAAVRPIEALVEPAFLSEVRAPEERGADGAERWPVALRATRAWVVPPEVRPMIEQVAPETYEAKAGMAIARHGRRMTAGDAARVMVASTSEASSISRRRGRAQRDM